LGKLKYFITLTKIEYESLICKAFGMCGVPGLGFDRRYPFIPGDYRHESRRKKIPEAKKNEVKVQILSP
jgi:hypothetical protein